VPGFALLSLTRAQRDTNGRVCSGELWVERLTNNDGSRGCQQRRPLFFGRRLLAQSGKRLSGSSFEIGVRIKAREVL